MSASVAGHAVLRPEAGASGAVVRAEGTVRSGRLALNAMAQSAGPRRRLDAELVRRGILESRQQATEAIAGGMVLVGGAPAFKASRLVGAGEAVSMLGAPPRFVSRGGEKLDAFLDRMAVDVAGRRALDVGASTGGFTDCLLQRGARAVVALDVGRGQLHERLRADPRVQVCERSDARSVDPVRIGAPFDLITVDVSFISLRLLAPVLIKSLAEPSGDLIVLVKPQFEAGRAEASRGRGVVSDPAVWQRVLGEVSQAFINEGSVVLGAAPSALRGSEGNVEFFLHIGAPPARGRPDAEGQTEVGVRLDPDWAARLVAEVADEAEPEIADSAPAVTEAGSGPELGGVELAHIAFMVHPRRPGALTLAKANLDWLHAAGHQAEVINGPPLPDGCDLAVSLGGDGTMLRTVELALPLDVPVMGINLGRLGYLTEVEPAALRPALERFLGAEHKLEERSVLEAFVWRAPPGGAVEAKAPSGSAAQEQGGLEPKEQGGLEAKEQGSEGQRGLALNEVVVERAGAGHTVRIAVWLGGRRFITYSADGVIVATPTGSTAYNLSARGPIISPDLDVVVLTAVCPHALFDRSLVLHPGTEVRLEVLDERPAEVVLDGQPLTRLKPGDSLVCRMAADKVRLVTAGDRDFHAVVRAKFDLTDR